MAEKLLLVLFVCFISVISQELIQYKNEQQENGYFFKFDLTDGQKREESGELTKKEGVEEKKVVGFYSFFGPDGKEYFTEYTADENGYRTKTTINEAPPGLAIPSAALASLAGGGLG